MAHIQRKGDAQLLDVSGYNCRTGIGATSIDGQVELEAVDYCVRQGTQGHGRIEGLAWGPDEIAQVLNDKAAEPSAPPSFGAAVAGFAQGGVPGAYPPAGPAGPGTPPPKPPDKPVK